MYIQNGIVYGDEPKEMIKVSNMKVLPNRIMILTFSNGEKRLFDADVLKGGVFEQLNDEKLFGSATIEYGVVTWDKGNIDCAPEFMYENSYEYYDKTDIPTIEFVTPEPDEIEAIMAGRKDRAENGTVSHDAINWD